MKKCIYIISFLSLCFTGDVTHKVVVKTYEFTVGGYCAEVEAYFLKQGMKVTINNAMETSNEKVIEASTESEKDSIYYYFEIYESAHKTVGVDAHINGTFKMTRQAFLNYVQEKIIPDFKKSVEGCRDLMVHISLDSGRYDDGEFDWPAKYRLSVFSKALQQKLDSVNDMKKK